MTKEVKIKGGRAMSSLVVRSRKLKRNSMRFVAALMAVLASFVARPNAALAAAPQHHDQQPGFYRLKVGDLEVTALFDGHGVFDLHWLNGTKGTMDGVAKALHEDPRLLDVSDEGFLVNTGKQLILVDAAFRSRRRPDHSGRKARLSKCRCLRRQGRKRLLVVAGNRCQGAEGCATVLPECGSHRSAVHQGR